MIGGWLMHRWSDSPVVSFSRGGQDLVLGRSGDDPVLHLYGSEGLGVAPVSVSKSERVAGDGSVVRGVRYGDREVFIPLLVEQPSTRDLNLWRRELNRLLAPVSGDPAGSLVDIRVEDPTTGTVRLVRGIYQDGLSGDFGTDFYGDWQTLGLTFDCPDPWWLGPERTETLQLNPGSKPFLSEGEVSRRNLVPNPLGPGATGVDYWRAVRGELSPDTVDGEFAARFTRDSVEGVAYFDPSRGFAPRPGSTLRFSVEVKVGTTVSLWPRILEYGGAAIVDDSGYVSQSPDDGWVRHETVVDVDAMPTDAYLRALLYVHNVGAGDRVWVRRVMVEVDTDGDYFDGDSPGCKWVGGENGPESVMWDPEQTTPFFPIVLAESVVQGDWSVTVEGDGPVWPVWEVHGPGTDLRITRGTERIEIDGEVREGEILLIDTQAGRITPDRWDDVSLRSTLFPLEPGRNDIKVSMVGATPDTIVRMVYRERFLEAI